MRRAKAIAARAQIPEVSIESIQIAASNRVAFTPCRDDSQRKTRVFVHAGKAQNLRGPSFCCSAWRFFRRRFSAFTVTEIAVLAHIVPDVRSRCVGCYRAAILFHQLYVRVEAPSVAGSACEKSWRRTGSASGILGGVPVGLAPATVLACTKDSHTGIWDFVHTFGPNLLCGRRGSLLVRHDQIRTCVSAGKSELVPQPRIYIAWKMNRYRLAGFSVLRRRTRNPQKSFMRAH